LLGQLARRRLVEVVDERVVVDGGLRLVGRERFAAAPPFATAP